MKIREMLRHFVRNKLEERGVFQPKLVAKMIVPISWNVDLDGDEVEEYEEFITFFLLEHKSGRRCFDIHCYGMNEETENFHAFMAPVMEWTHGGVLPKTAELTSTSAAILSIKSGKKLD